MPPIEADAPDLPAIPTLQHPVHDIAAHHRCVDAVSGVIDLAHVAARQRLESVPGLLIRLDPGEMTLRGEQIERGPRQRGQAAFALTRQRDLPQPPRTPEDERAALTRRYRTEGDGMLVWSFSRSKRHESALRDEHDGVVVG